MTRRPTCFVVCGLVLGSVLVMRASASAQRSAPPPDRAAQSAALDCGGEPCAAAVRGFLAFFDRRPGHLGGNGRSCADCHLATDNFQLSPADAEERFQRLQQRRTWDATADDPLFRPIDADDFRVNGDQASDYSNLRQNGLIRITFALPPGIRLIDPATNAPSAESFVDVWRSVPTVNNVAITGADDQNPWPRGPNTFGGYQLDARIATLQEQATGALTNHAQVERPPSTQLLDDLSSFQRLLFSSNRVRALADAMRAGTTPLPDPDPPLNDLEQQGKVVFVRACAQCHGGPTQTTATVPVRFHDILSQCPRPVDTVSPARFAFKPCEPGLARNARTYDITLSVATPSPTGVLPAGSHVRRTSSDPGRALLTGFVGGAAPTDDWNKLDMPTLHGISGTAPYFHNNSAATLEEVVDHYVELFKRIKANAAPGAPPPPVATTDGIHFDRQPQPEERAALLAYLRKL